MSRVTISPPPQAAGLQRALQELLRRAASPTEFVEGWLKQVAAASAAGGGRVHRPSSSGTLAAVAEFGRVAATVAGEEAESSPRAAQLQRALCEVYSQGRPQFFAALTDVDGEDANNLPHALLPLIIDGEIRGTVELLFPGDSKSERVRAAATIVAAGIPYFAEYERLQRQREFDRRSALVDEIERFTRSVHEKLSVRHTAYVAANDGRKIIGCDRLTVLLRRGRRYDVIAVSGADEIENRSQAAKLLSQLAGVAAATGETVDSFGKYEDLPPQLREAMNQYLDETHVRGVTVVPLLPVDAEKTDAASTPSLKRKPPLGALVLEQMEDVTPDSGRSERAAFIAQHTTLALAKALEHETIPLLPLWKLSAAAAHLFAPGTRAKTWAIIAVVAAVLAALKFVQADFVIHASGTLQPVGRRHVFAPLDSTVKAVHVRHGDHVEAGQLLLELRNADLDVAWTDATGQRMSAYEQLLAVERSLYEDSSKISVEERHRIAGRRSELKQKIESLDEQLQILRRKRDQLRVVSPIAGEVTTWDVEQSLRDRPIRQGQVLLDVAEVAGAWELEVKVPEDGIAQLLAAQETQGTALRVSYRLAAEPRTDRSAAIRDVHYAAEIRGEDGNTVLAKASLVDQNLPGIRSGAEATTKIYCGRRALGYVWLHDAVDFLRKNVWFHLY